MKIVKKQKKVNTASQSVPWVSYKVKLLDAYLSHSKSSNHLISKLPFREEAVV